MKRLKDFMDTNKDSMKYLKKFESWEEHDAYYDDEPSTVDEVAQKWYELLDNDFFLDFIEAYPSKEEFEERLNSYKSMMNEEESEVYMLETEFRSFPGEDDWSEFYNELIKVNW